MRTTRIKLLKRGYRTDISEVDQIVRDMVAAAEKSGFETAETDITMDLTTSNYEVEVHAEKRGKNGSEFSFQHIWASQDGQKSPSIILPSTNGGVQL